MDPSELSHYKAVNSIVERDSTFATYKYALLRGVIEICRDLPPDIREEENRVFLPLGRLIEKWLIYYYPIFSSERFIPQQGGEKKDRDSQISFRKMFLKITDFYRELGGYSQWYSDYQRGKIPKEIQPEFLDLCKKIRSTIITMPMDHLGYSLHGKPYSVFDYSRKRIAISRDAIPTRDFLFDNFGEFYFVQKEIYDVFTLFGGYLTGETTILQKWAQLTHKMDASISPGEMISILSQYPVEERNVQAAEQFLSCLREQDYPITCIWSGRLLGKTGYHIDHMLPFSICKNNDLWNLMPTDGPVNEAKSDLFPSRALIERQKENIINYWTRMSEYDPDLFFRELRLSLVGNILLTKGWQETAFSCLIKRCNDMTGMLGYGEWDGP
ncbi:MAG: HNH endonuclease domain-containing protein [Methanomicrobiales archaeon]